ncbi:trigger factor [Rhodocyclus tenuis]|uniref:Trigger factor n=2 Tax=Rhodocyclus TaxID=1064 RepID=A0A6L5JUK5_RHOTE|nr:trigger factor [Rhodocyclus gracilis]MQY51063.1 trigger factor [Rhodocyclus gracilis]NJA88773.1 trigger factor [Rhodocyclus gracilis]
MQTNVANTSASEQSAAPVENPLERRVDIAVALADFEKDVEQRLKLKGRTLKLAGFRPGKAPQAIVRRQFGDEARHEALTDAIDRAFGEAVQAQKLRVAGYPRIEAKATESTTHLEFSAVFEVYPEVKVGALEGEKIERAAFEVTPAEIDSTLDILRHQRVRYEEADRAAENGDQLVIDFLGRKGDEPFAGGQANDYGFVLGRGAMLADFEAAIVGLKAGESKTFDMTFPADYPAAELAGQAVSFDVTVKKVSAPVLPEVDADFARALGVEDGDVQRMRSEIEGNLRREVKKRLRARVKDQVLELLLKVTPVQAPKALVEGEVERLVDQARKEMEQRGIKGADFPVQPEWFTEKAERRVKLGLILAQVIRENDLKADPAEVRSLIEEAAQSYENPDEVVRWYYSQPQRLAEIEAVAVEAAAVDWVLAKASVSDAPIAFEELMGRQS